MIKEKCKAYNCDKERYGLKEYCRKHYLQIQKYGRLAPELEVNPIIKGSICSNDGCDKAVYSKNLCRHHWNKQRIENLKAKNELGDKNISRCKVKGCNDIVLSKGYCLRHYNQISKHGKIILIERKIYPTTCQVEGCIEKSYSCGYCQKHYTQWYNHGDPLYINNIKGCNIENCDRKYYAKGYCRKHYLEFIMKPKEQKLKESRFARRY